MPVCLCVCVCVMLCVCVFSIQSLCVQKNTMPVSYHTGTGTQTRHANRLTVSTGNRGDQQPRENNQLAVQKGGHRVPRSARAATGLRERARKREGGKQTREGGREREREREREAPTGACDSHVLKQALTCRRGRETGGRGAEREKVDRLLEHVFHL